MNICPMTNEPEVFINPNPIIAPVDNDKPSRKMASKILLYFLIFITFTYGIFLSVLIGSSYTGYQPPLIPKNFIRITDSALGSIPIIPKTPKQVLTNAIVSTEQVKSGNVRFIMEVSSFGLATSDSLELKLTFDGVVDEVDQNISNFDFSASLDMKSGKQNVNYTADLVAVSNLLYFRFGEIDGNKEISNKWFKIDLKKVEKELGTTNTSEEDLEKQYKKQVRKFFETLEEKKIFQKIEQLGDDDIDGKSSYHYRLSLTEEEIIDLLGEDFKDLESFINFDRSKIDIWVEKGTNYMNKFIIDYEISYDFSQLGLSSSPQDIGFNFKLESEITNINGDVEINEPEGAKEVESFLEPFEESLPSIIQNQNTNPFTQTLGVTNPDYNIVRSALTFTKTLRNFYSLPKLIGRSNN